MKTDFATFGKSLKVFEHMEFYDFQVCDVALFDYDLFIIVVVLEGS